MSSSKVFIHPSVTRHVSKLRDPSDMPGFGKRAVQAGAIGFVATTVLTNTGVASAVETVSFEPTEIQPEVASSALPDQNVYPVTFGSDSAPAQESIGSEPETISAIGGVGEVVRPGYSFEDTAGVLEVSDPDPEALDDSSEPEQLAPNPTANFNVSVVHSETSTAVEAPTPAEEAPAQLPIIAGISGTTETSENESTSNPEVVGQTEIELLNNLLAGISIEDLDAGPVDINNVVIVSRFLDNKLAALDQNRPQDLPDGVIKLYLHNEAPGLGVPFTVAERTAPVERFGTQNMVGTIYAMAEVYQQLVEKEFPQYAGSMLRVRDLFSPHHRTHNKDDVDVSAAMNPNVTWYSDGPIMDKYSDNYDAEFTQRFFELISNLHINGQRAVYKVVFEDQQIVNHLDSAVDANYGGMAQWHTDHAHLDGRTSGPTYSIDPSLIPWDGQQDLKIRSEGVPISEEQRRAAHGEFLDFIESGDFPAGSLRSKIVSAPETTPIAEPVIESITPEVVAEEEIVETEGTIVDGRYSPPVYGENVTPDISDVAPQDESGYMQAVASGDLPDPYEYQFFETGEPLSLLRAMEISQQIIDRGYDFEWGETQLVRLTPEEYVQMYRLAGIPEYDIPNMIGLTRGESGYFTQIVGDIQIGGAVGPNQHLERYLTDPSQRSHMDMFDPWLNILETREKYFASWQRNGFEGRFRDWNAVNNNTDAFKAGVQDALDMLSSQD